MDGLTSRADLLVERIQDLHDPPLLLYRGE
jgi:hypothetical protein